MWISRKEFNDLKLRVDNLESQVTFPIWKETNTHRPWFGKPDDFIPVKHVLSYMMAILGFKLTYEPPSGGKGKIEYTQK